jgi:hypothetical protein
MALDFLQEILPNNVTNFQVLPHLGPLAHSEADLSYVVQENVWPIVDGT